MFDQIPQTITAVLMTNATAFTSYWEVSTIVAIDADADADADADVEAEALWCALLPTQHAAEFFDLYWGTVRRFEQRRLLAQLDALSSPSRGGWWWMR
ncbi:hypothetical protein B6S59_05175 [Pseudomonas sp. A46]|nr:hypothetical protein [Pseudomonas sp. A46]OWJ96847.1 hypothetical protein B6S59_05175 [Pseudomonas sp. A46]